jgi:hypothetical protein
VFSAFVAAETIRKHTPSSRSVMPACSKGPTLVAPRTWILDLQVIRPDPYVELESEVVARIHGEPLFA